MSYIALVGLVVSAAGTAYSINAQNNAIDAANSARPRDFVPINIGRTAALAHAADVTGYKLSDEDFERRFPKLVQGREYNIDNASKQLAGGTSEQLKTSMDKAGLSANLGTDEFQKAQNLGKPILAMQQRDRNYFSRLLAENPQRNAGLSGADVTKLALQNTGAQNAFNSDIFGNKIKQYNASIAQGINNTQAATSGLASLAGLFSDYGRPRSNQPNSLDPSYYSRFTTGSGGGWTNVGGYGG